MKIIYNGHTIEGTENAVNKVLDKIMEHEKTQLNWTTVTYPPADGTTTETPPWQPTVTWCSAA